jgi:hypothetical protein
VVGAEECFTVCETRVDLEKGPNGASNVTALGQGRYEIVLDHPIVPNGVTTIEYEGGSGHVEYKYHPANVNGIGVVNPTDITALLNCCIQGSCATAHGLYSCDIDHSGAFTAPDLIDLIDLINGAGPHLTPAFGTPLPQNNGACP